MAGVAANQRPVLVVLIGWAKRYDGTEAIVGGHAFLKDNPEDNGELQAFVRQPNGLFRCGVGKGAISETKPDVMFVARNPESKRVEAVAVYSACMMSSEDESSWHTAQTTRAVCIPFGRRPVCVGWPAGQGMRRWARRVDSHGAEHPGLLSTYRKSMVMDQTVTEPEDDQFDPELSAFEGSLKTMFVRHRKREAKLRAAKIRQALTAGRGHLACEVPNCGFDFLKRYGELGRNFAVVHHRRPLRWVPKKGSKTSLDDLAIVCANCHQMIHRDGGCRELSELIGK